MASGRWPPGTVGTVVKRTKGGGAIVEIDDERGHTQDWLALPQKGLRLVEAPRQERLRA